MERKRVTNVKNLLRVAISLIVPLAIFAPAASATTTGDTCSADGNGSTAYSVSINIPANAPAQQGFAVSASGSKVTAITSTETGTLSTHSLPAHTSAAWILTTAAVPGGPTTLDVTTDAKNTGSFTIIPTGTSAFPAFSCAVSVGITAPSAAFTSLRTATYDASAGAWHLRVTVPSGGTIRSVQEVQMTQVQPARTSISGTKLTVKTGGTYALVLKPTGIGETALKSHHSIAVKLSITFAPTVGRPASRILDLTLTK
jgi:hypothetical protein